MINRFRLLPAYYVFLVVLLYLPLLVLLLFSFNDGTALSFPLRGFTSDWYEGMLANGQLLAAARNSAVVGIGVSTIATILGTLAAIALVRYKFPGKTLFLMVAVTPLLVPFLILGVALLILFSALDVDRSLLTVGAAHVVVAIPYTVLIVASRLVGFDRNLEEAAFDLGASFPYFLRRVLVPLIAPAMLAAWLVAFTVSFDEFVLASFTIGREPTLPVFIFGQVRFANRFPQVVALASVVMIFSLGLVLAAQRLQSAWTRR